MRNIYIILNTLAILLISQFISAQTTYTVTKNILDGTEGSLNWALNQAKDAVEAGNDVTVYFNVPGDDDEALVDIPSNLYFNPASGSTGILSLLPHPSAINPQGIIKSESGPHPEYFSIKSNLAIGNLTIKRTNGASGIFLSSQEREGYTFDINNCVIDAIITCAVEKINVHDCNGIGALSIYLWPTNNGKSFANVRNNNFDSGSVNISAGYGGLITFEENTAKWAIFNLEETGEYFINNNVINHFGAEKFFSNAHLMY